MVDGASASAPSTTLRRVLLIICGGDEAASDNFLLLLAELAICGDEAGPAELRVRLRAEPISDVIVALSLLFYLSKEVLYM